MKMQILATLTFLFAVAGCSSGNGPFAETTASPEQTTIAETIPSPEQTPGQAVTTSAPTSIPPFEDDDGDGGDNSEDPGCSDCLEVGGSITVLNPTGDSIRLRVTPSMTSVTFATVPNGSTAVITGGPTSAEGYTWFEIETSEGTGWTRSDVLQP